MSYKENEKEYFNFYENGHESVDNKNFNFNFEFDLDDAEDKGYIDNVENKNSDDCKDQYNKGFKDGYVKAIHEFLSYMKKNKCCIKRNHKSKFK